jgi:hypothetical protein
MLPFHVRPEQVQQRARTKSPLLDHLVSAGEQRGWHVEAEGFRGFHVD